MANYYADQSQANRNAELAEGGQLNDQLQNQINSRYANEGAYQGTADSLYRDLQTTPGYTDQQSQAIIDQNQLDQLQLTPEQQQSNYLTQQEQAGIQGNTNDLVNEAQHAGSMIYGSLGDAENRVGNAQSFQRDALGNAYTDLANNSRAAIDPSKLGLSKDYTDAASGALSTGGSNVRAAVDNPDLGLSSDYLQNHQFGADDQQQMALAAENDIGTATRSRQEDVARAADASGGVSPLALAAGYNRLQQQGDINSEDAALNARVAAKKLGLDTTQGTEDTRQAAVGRNAGLQSSAEENLLSQNLGQANQQEQLRQGAEQYITGAQLNNEQNLGNQNLTNERTLGSQNLQAAEDLNSQNLSGTEAAENLQLNTATSAEAANAARAQALATNRQNTNQYNQGSTYQRGTYADTADSTRNQTVADKSLAGQQEARQYYTGQTQYEGNQATANQGQQLQNYATKYGLANQSTATAGGIQQAATNNGFFGSDGLGGKLATAAIGAAGRAIKPTP